MAHHLRKEKQPVRDGHWNRSVSKEKIIYSLLILLLLLYEFLSASLKTYPGVVKRIRKKRLTRCFSKKKQKKIGVKSNGLLKYRFPNEAWLSPYEENSKMSHIFLLHFCFMKHFLPVTKKGILSINHGWPWNKERGRNHFHKLWPPTSGLIS